MKHKLIGRVALITGASRGIGRAIALLLGQNGVNLAVNARSEGALFLLKEELSSYGVDVLVCPGDLQDPLTPSLIIKKVIDYFGKLDILINNAGLALAKPLSETTLEEWDMLMAVNARAPFLLSKEAIPYLKRSDMATIINISSVVGVKGYINQGAYTASKHALMGLTKVLAQEVFQDGIRVHVISPGGVATSMVELTRPDIDPSTLISPEEIAEIVLFLLTHRGNAVIDEINVRRSANPPWR
ncbi:MAG: SDR family NAD(P)-dependent oxidoreductase [bacterium]